MRRKKTIKIAVLLVIIVILGYVTFELIKLASFPGKITTPDYRVKTEGVKSTFRHGVIYRYPGIVPFLSVSGDHYEMGLQYGVLLRPEIMHALESYKKILRWEAKKINIPYPIFTAVLKYKARKLSKSLPDRFLEEIKGGAEGSGVPEDAIIMVSLFYDVGMSMGCTGLLMRGKDGSIIHGRNNDWFEGEEIGKLTVVVQYNATGYNSATHIDFPLWMGVETGYNDKGLAFSEETYGIKKPNPKGFSIVYLARIALETCSTLDEVSRMLDKYSVIGGYGTVWSDRDEGRGTVAELTPTAHAVKEMQGSMLWNFNHIYDPKLRQQQRTKANINGWNLDREEIASAFPKKPVYEIKDAFEFLRAQKGPDGTDYSWYGTKTPICNDCGLQTVVFDPQGNGFYLAIGTSYAARQKVYHIPDDFSQSPKLFMEAVPIEPVVKEAARIKNMLANKEEKLMAYVNLAQKYNEDTNAQFLVAYNSFHQSRWDLFAHYALRAYSMKPFVAEYRLFAGIAAYQQKEPDRAIELLEDIEFSKLDPLEQIYGLVVLEKVWALRDHGESVQYRAKIEKILDEYDLHSYYRKEIIPLFEKL
jgi:predicted choloylglycine hydrolase